jgi:membrane peptidoglycan carboxypeptidase
MFLGEKQFITTLNKIGINDVQNNVSLPLGTSEINIIELTSAYQVFGNKGIKTDNYLIRKIESKDNKILYKHKKEERQILNNNYVYIMSELLRNCYDYELVDYNSPTCLSIRPKITKKYAIKTGSTNTDSLIVGYNKDYTLGVWAGYDDNEILKDKDNLFARNIWVDTMENYLRNKDESWFEKPKDINAVLVNPLNGKIATNESKKKKFIYYLKGTEPTKFDK